MKIHKYNLNYTLIICRVCGGGVKDHLPEWDTMPMKVKTLTLKQLQTWEPGEKREEIQPRWDHKNGAGATKAGGLTLSDEKQCLSAIKQRRKPELEEGCTIYNGRKWYGTCLKYSSTSMQTKPWERKWWKATQMKDAFSLSAKHLSNFVTNASLQNEVLISYLGRQNNQKSRCRWFESIMHRLFKHDLHISNCLPADLHGNKGSEYHSSVSSPFPGTISSPHPPFNFPH